MRRAAESLNVFYISYRRPEDGWMHPFFWRMHTSSCILLVQKHLLVKVNFPLRRVVKTSSWCRDAIRVCSILFGSLFLAQQNNIVSAPGLTHIRHGGRQRFFGMCMRVIESLKADGKNVSDPRLPPSRAPIFPGAFLVSVFLACSPMLQHAGDILSYQLSN